MLTNREEFVAGVEMMKTLWESNHSFLHFLIEKERKAKNNPTFPLVLERAYFKGFQERTDKKKPME